MKMKIVLTHPTGYTEIVSDEGVYLDIQIGEYKRQLRIIPDGRVFDETTENKTEI